MTGEPAHPIYVRSLTKKYGQSWAVRNVDLEVRQGEVLALLGPNGAGKTSTVEILQGFRRATSGEVRVLGADPARGSRAWRARLGVVPQTTGAFADLTVREVVAHFAAFYPAPLAPDEVLEMVGLSDQRRKQSDQLSGGQRRRLDVAVGVVGDPDLIFLDEPTTGLDPQARREAWDLVTYFADRGKTTLLTTHYLDEAEQLADRVAVMTAGRIVAVGTPDDIGGRATVPVEVSFGSAGDFAGALPSPVADRVLDSRIASDRVILHTQTPTALMAALIDWARSIGVEELPDLSIRRPTLEEVYLSLIENTSQSEQG